MNKPFSNLLHSSEWASTDRVQQVKTSWDKSQLYEGITGWNSSSKKKKIHLCETVRYPVIQHYTNKYCANSKSLRHWKLISAIQLLITYFTFDHWLLRSSKTWFGRPVSHTAWQITFACTKGQVLTSAQVSSFHILLLIQFSYVEHIQNVFSSCITAIVSSLPPRSW